ncbi:MAG: T9SS type A sorting domain-containing protein [Paludibacteraceae bacterium]
MTHYTIYVDSCWTMGNGNPDLIVTNDPDWEYGQKNTIPTGWAGDGNGFKLGGDDWAAKHQVRNCISFDGYETGACYSENNNADSLFIFNCVAWQGNKNFRVRAYPSDLRNNISFDPKVGGEGQMFDLAAGTTEKNNSWNSIDGQYALVPYKTADGKTFDQKSIYNQFVSTSKSDFLAPRDADGSLPKNGFGRLKAGSVFIDKGTNTVRGINSVTLKSYDFSVPFSGAALDLGAYEYQTPTGVSQINSTDRHLKAYPNPFYTATSLDLEAAESGEGQFIISDLAGKTIYAQTISGLMAGEKRTVRIGNELGAGIYIANFINGKYHQSLKLIKIK